MEWAQGAPPTVSDTARNLAERPAGFVARTDFSFAMIERESGRIVGTVSLFALAWDVPRGEVGYWVRTDAVGRGYATEAVRAVAKVAFEALGLVRLELRCDARNVRSRAVALRADFVLEGVLRSERRDPQGGLRDSCVYARLASDPCQVIQ